MFVFLTCKCGNHSIASLQNNSWNFIVGCNELEGCQDSKKSDHVLEDIGADVIFKFVTEYPELNLYAF